MHAKTSIQDVMTPSPHSIGADQTLKVAKDMLQEYGIRHLPVRDGGQLVGIASDRDIHFALAVEEKYDFELQIRDVYTPEPYLVEPDTLLSEVVNRLAKDRIGSALVVKNGELLGIYTAVDACRDLGMVLTTVHE